MATGFVNRKWQFSTPYKINTPQVITKKSIKGDHIGDPNSCAKFGGWASVQICEI